MQSKGVRVLLIFFVVCLLMTSATALKITGAICEKKISSGATFICPVVLETESPAIVTLEVFGTGYTITKDELSISPTSPGEFTIKGTAPATGYIKITAIDDSTSGMIRYGVSTFVKVCINSPCPEIPIPTHTQKPTPTITTQPTIEPIETITTIEEMTPVITYEPKDNRSSYTLIGAVCLGIFVAIALILYIREKRSGK